MITLDDLYENYNEIVEMVREVDCKLTCSNCGDLIRVMGGHYQCGCGEKTCSSPSVTIELLLQNEKITASCQNLTRKQMNELKETCINKERAFVTAFEIK